MKPQVTTKYGVLEGVQRENYQTYFGIPYAKAPVGELRWRAPQSPECWDGVRDASSYGNRAWQIPSAPLREGESGIDYYREFYSNREFVAHRSEDCLFLNIWTPKAQEGQNLPVAFWIHGGAFLHGSGSEMEFDGEAFCKRGVILVTINYRVGAFGFLAHPAFAEEDSHQSAGNYGILDQIQALRWVRENIAAFGGDPDRITVFGQSAGAMSVQTLISSPLTKGMIAGAIMQSAAGYRHKLELGMTMEQAQTNAQIFSQVSNCHTAQEMRALSAEDVYENYLKMLGICFQNGTGLPFNAVLDGYVLEKDCNCVIFDGDLPNIPYMLGTTGDDLFRTPENIANHTLSPLYYGCINFATKCDELEYKPAYVYYFDRKLPGNDDGAFHSAELWYVFETLGRCWRPMEEHDYALAEQICSYWCNFIKTGDPNGENLPVWTPCSLTNHHVQELK